MRVTVLSTHTNNCPPFYEPLRGLGHEISLIVYDLMSEDAFVHLPWIVAAHKPDFVILIGAHRDFHGRPVVPTHTLAQIGSKFPLVHLCCDGAEPVWWPILAEYYEQGRFALQVNIDGLRTGPIGEHGITLLSPFDPSLYPITPKPWHERRVDLGFAGSIGGSHRAHILHQLDARKVLIVKRRVDQGELNDASYREFLTSCRCILNHAATGSGQRQHVKGRVLEAAYAGALLFEQKDSPLSDWFKPDVDYLTYVTEDDVVTKLDWVRSNLIEAERIALSFRKKMIDQHAPAIFWKHVLSKIGLAEKEQELYQPAFRPYVLHQAPPASAASIPYIGPVNMQHVGPPRFMVAVNGYNLVSFAGEIYVIPQRLGKVHLEKPEDRTRPGIHRFGSEVEARRAVAMR